MPEGPEIRLAADRVHRALAGQEIAQAWCKLPQLSAPVAALAGRRVERVTAHGKLMLTQLDSGQTLLSHNQLYGRWYTSKAGATPKTQRDLRLALHNQSRSAWLFSASDIDLVADEGWDHPWRAKLGPDVLDDALSTDAVAERFCSSRWRGRSLGALLLDQSFLAGPGNYIRIEALFLAGLLPQHRPRDLGDAAIGKLAKMTLAVPRRSYATRGIVNSDENIARLKAAGATRSKYRFWIFKREGQGCYRCGAEVRRGSLSGRPMFWCPECQK
jgi:endonuclease-8